MPDPRAGLVSAIIPVYNRPRLLADAVASVLAQTYRPIEILVVDDGSTDETAAVAQALAAAHPGVVHYMAQPHAGQPFAGCARGRNHGLRAASGEFIQFLDSDDLLMPEKFATQVLALREHPDCGISYCQAREYAIGDPPPSRPARQTGRTFSQLFPDLLLSRIWPSSSPLYRREVVAANGPLAEVVNSDWEFECRVAARGVKLHHCRQFLTDVRNTHVAEGRRQPNARREALPRNVEAHERMLASARQAGVPAQVVDAFARRLFALGRACADTGFEPEARRCLTLARDNSSARVDRSLMAAYVAVSNGLGWQWVGARCQGIGRAAKGSFRRARTFRDRWWHRATVALHEVSAKPVRQWPVLLATLWAQRGGRRLSP